MNCRTVVLSALTLLALPCFAQEQNVDAVVRVPVYENTADVSKTVLGTYAAVSGKSLRARARAACGRGCGAGEQRSAAPR